jgi:MFS family permease
VKPDRGARSYAPLFVLFLVNVLNFYDRQVLGAVAEPLRHEFHLSDTQLAVLTTAFTLLYAVAGLPLGRLADRWKRRPLLAMGVAVWAGLTGLGGLAVSYAMLLATRLGVGIGEAVCAPAATSWIGDTVPPRRRARAMAWFMMAIPMGGFLSFAVGGPVAQAYGWRAALVLAAIPGALLVPALLALREPAREAGALETATARPIQLARIPAFWWIAASGAVVNFMLYSFSMFLPAFLTRYHGLSVARAGLWSGIGTGMAGVAGALAAGYWGDRARGPLARRRLRAAAISAAVASPLAWWAIAAPPGRVAAVVIVLMTAYALWQMYYGLVYAAIQDVVPAALRGTAMAAYYMTMYLCGASFGPLVTGRLSDRFARQAMAGGAASETARAIGLHSAMYLVPLSSIVLAGVLFAAARSAGECE